MSPDMPETPPCPSFVSRPGEFAAGPDSICATCAESGASHGIMTIGSPTQMVDNLGKNAANVVFRRAQDDVPRNNAVVKHFRRREDTVSRVFTTLADDADNANRLLGRAAELIRQALEVEPVDGRDAYELAKRWQRIAIDWRAEYEAWLKS